MRDHSKQTAIAIDRRRVALAVAVLVVILTAATAASLSGATSRTSKGMGWYSATPTARHGIAVTGADRGERAIARSIVQRLGSRSRVRSVVFDTPAPDFHAPAGSLWANVTVDAHDGQGGLAYAFWQAALTVAALQEAHAAQDLPLIAGKSVTAVLPDGATISLGSTVIPPAVAAPAAQAAPLIAAAKAAASARGLHVANAGVLNLGRGPGVFVNAITDDPKLVIDTRSAITLGLFNAYYDRSAGIAGFYLEVRDHAGALVAATAYATQTGDGASWANPQFGIPPDVSAPVAQ